MVFNKFSEIVMNLVNLHKKYLRNRCWFHLNFTVLQACSFENKICDSIYGQVGLGLRTKDTWVVFAYFSPFFPVWLHTVDQVFLWGKWLCWGVSNEGIMVDDRSFGSIWVNTVYGTPYWRMMLAVLYIYSTASIILQLIVFLTQTMNVKWWNYFFSYHQYSVHESKIKPIFVKKRYIPVVRDFWAPANPPPFLCFWEFFRFRNWKKKF